ncbi:MAG: alkane 1-monooxygenase [Woeseia sp.]|nr:alkane 1-monooxygenase [Woeseia sp.]
MKEPRRRPGALAGRRLSRHNGRGSKGATMAGLIGTSADGSAVFYQDHKRWLWALSVFFPLQIFIGIALHAQTGNQLWLLLPLLLNYVGGPLLDALFGEDENNPPEEVVMQLERDRYYRYLTYIAVPVHLLSFYGAAWWAGSQNLSWWAFIGLAAIAGMTSGLAINTGHELGHKRSPVERLLSRFVLAIPMYGHFTIDHNRGHHRDVSTPEDCASSRMGESIYRFALREIPGAFIRAWEIEKERLERRSLSVWSKDNFILRSLCLSLLIQGFLVVWLGWQMIVFLLVHNALAYWQLTSANYIEHYGLLRKRDSEGRYERCKPYHSWNSNHIVSNLSLFHLERHSDHHTHPLRRYQSLRHFPELPSLPTGYFGCYLLAWVPPLWFRVMDKRLLALPHVNHDLNNVNVDPRRHAALAERYGLAVSTG